MIYTKIARLFCESSLQTAAEEPPIFFVIQFFEHNIIKILTKRLFIL